MAEAGLARISPRLALTVGACGAIASRDEEALTLVESALDTPGCERWPFEHARVELAYGERLRRAKHTVESRHHLTRALATFERLGATPWAKRASSELRAAGRPGAGRGGRNSLALTPQELEIANLAASGLTNKQIGDQLFLSHRTVSAHLYRIFPKLGITSRAALRDALED
jgi:DNA-binding CsgD family transcriptional regulator